MNINDLQDNIGKCALYANGNIIFIDTECIQMATYQIFNSLKTFENTGNISSDNRAIISLIFIALENYIGTLLKVLSELNKNINYEQLIKNDISIRLKKLIEYLNGNPKNIYQETNIANLIREFSTFRNEIFHDRRRVQKYTHTNFKSDIDKINIEDSIEALRIFINLCLLFSKSIIGLNLMPNIIMYKGKTFYFERLDFFYNKLIKEYYSNILKKHNIETQANFELNNYYIWKNSLYSFKNIQPIIKVKSNRNIAINSEITNIGETLYQTIINDRNISDINMELPNLFDN